MTEMMSVIAARIAGAWRCFLIDLPRPPLGWVLPSVLALCGFMGFVVDRTVIRAAAEMDETYRRFFEIVTKVLGHLDKVTSEKMMFELVDKPRSWNPVSGDLHVGRLLPHLFHKGSPQLPHGIQHK